MRFHKYVPENIPRCVNFIIDDDKYYRMILTMWVDPGLNNEFYMRCGIYPILYLWLRLFKFRSTFTFFWKKKQKSL